MCQYRKQKTCSVTNTICPWAYWCGTINDYKDRDSCNTYCKILKKESEKEKPKGFYEVKFERHGFLYVDFDGLAIKVQNPFENIPKFVKIKKGKTSYKVIK